MLTNRYTIDSSEEMKRATEYFLAQGFAVHQRSLFSVTLARKKRQSVITKVVEELVSARPEIEYVQLDLDLEAEGARIAATIKRQA
jgi:hypothetical protein